MRKITKSLYLFTNLLLVSCQTTNNSLNYSYEMSQETTLLKEASKANSYAYSDYQNPSFLNFLSKLEDFSLDFNNSFLNNFDDKKSNNALSPLSIFFALSITSECASGETKAQILKAFDLSSEDLKENIPLLYSLENFLIQDQDNKNIAIRDLQNTLWFDKSFPKIDQTLDTIANYYYTSSYETDFKNHNDTANKDFSSYIKEKTRGLIDKDFQLSEDTLFVILNTLYLKDIWNKEGMDLPLTNEKHDFKNRDASITKTKLMMGNYVSGRTLKTEMYESFHSDTSYGLSLHLLKPNEGYELQEVFNKENITNILNKDNYEYTNEEEKLQYYTRTYFPSFSAESNIDLLNILEDDFAITDMFNNKADFSSISKQDIYCNRVIHSTKLNVETKGIEGAAITAFAFEPTSIEPIYKNVYETFVVDKSFGYVLTDDNGVILFSGVVNKI